MMCLKVVVPVAFLFAACTAPGGPERYPGTEFPSSFAGGPGSGLGGAGGDILIPQALCATAQASEAMPARSSVSDPNGGTAVAPRYFTSNLYGVFKAVCGGCHVESNRGNFSVSESTFSRTVDESIYAVIISDDPATFMPPASGGGVPFSQRSSSDAVVQLQVLLKLWIEQGRPEDAFELPAEEGGPQAGYVVSPELASKLTNIGTCIPDKRMVATSTSSMDALDKTFAAATTLPPTLAETDLDALDSETLANHGVVSYAPAYPLWTDNAGKMRYVRVPRGKAIVFDKAKQQFHVPDNTRFYKTFLKSVVDANGNPSYRKIETRLIVARQDVDSPDGTVEQKALYGTYIWNEAETQATLLTDPLRNGKPFSDRLFSYVTDESKAQAIIDKNPRNLASALQSAGLTRHYAVPGARRCVQCHMGSPSHDFSLGFTPLQVARRPIGAGGVLEPAARNDELNQLQRLIDYGVITGIASAADVLPLETSQGARKPRNNEELTAQGYLLGNCAHCHNARGFPSVKQPALKDVLVFLPGTGPRDGIFQMPLELMSPTRKRGLNRDVPIPYITPSLYDVPRLGSTAKYFCPNVPEGACAGTREPPSFVLAPWRSLIYRNVDTPYDYFDDFTPYPHMPLNSPGFDCRVTKILGDWMVSIPALIKDPNKLEYALPSSDANGNVIYASNANTDPQPYRESKPGDADYAQAVSGAEFRLGIYHQVGHRYGFCPTTYTQDIINPFTVEQVNKKLPVTSDVGVIYDPTDLTKAVMPPLTPRRPHWVNFDDTEPPGDWFPRRPDWEDALVHPDIPTFVHHAVTDDNLSVEAAQDLTNVLEALLTVKLTSQIRNAITQEVPFGLWDTSLAGCNFSGVKTVESFQGARRPTWMDIAQAPATAPVYEQSYGSAVFNTVCFNCHGANADSKGLLADEIAIMTGGDARVANFRDGLFGPVDHPGTNRDRVFGPGAAALGGGVTGDDVAARYMAWMSLGGTTKHLPMEVLAQVSDAPVLGALRSHIALEGTPDMLRLGLDLCRQIVSSDPSATEIPVADIVALGRYNWSRFSGLIDSNGDAEMWLRLCSLDNRAVVRVPFVANNAWSATTAIRDLRISGYNLYWGSGPAGEDYYGPNPVLDHHGDVTNGISADNDFPLCIQKPSDPTERQNADRALAASPVKGKQIPYCPDGFVSPGRKLVVSETGDPVDGRRWAARGAINAALAVFTYLDQIERDPSKRKPLHNQCDLLGRH